MDVEGGGGEVGSGQGVGHWWSWDRERRPQPVVGLWRESNPTGK